MKNYVAGLLKYAPDVTYFLAHTLIRIIWSVDNRTAGFRLCGQKTKAIRMECRIGGSDINPYLALAGQLAAGMAGIEEKLELAPPLQGGSGMIPQNLTAARSALVDSTITSSV